MFLISVWFRLFHHKLSKEPLELYLKCYPLKNSLQCSKGLLHVFVYPGSWPFAWFPDLALVHKFYLPYLVPNLYLPALAPNLCLPTLAINLYLQALAYNIITNLGPEFCIYQSCLLHLCLCFQLWPMICITGLESEFAFILLLVVVVALLLVVVIVVISLEQIIPIFVCRF